MLKQIIFLYLMILSAMSSDSECDPFFDPYSVFNKSIVDYWCFNNYITIQKKQNCNWDTWATNKKEGGRNQTSQLIVEEHYNIYSSSIWNSEKVVVLYQKYFGTPSIGNKILVNNEHEHLAFFQTYINIENELKTTDNGFYRLVKESPKTVNSVRTLSTTVETSKEIGVGFLGQLLGSLGKDAGVSGKVGGNFAFSKSQQNTKTESTSFTDWGVENKRYGQTSKWTIHQQYPFDGDDDTPQNFMNWIGKATDRNYKHDFKYFAKTLPKLSTNSIEGCVVSVWLVSDDTRYIEVTTKVSHGLGDWVVGSNIKYHNNYHVKEHNYINTKIINLIEKTHYSKFKDIFTVNITANH
ncbi:hypothetical protein ACTFIZ_011033 [Dictyostelium cf. discoideum]